MKKKFEKKSHNAEKIERGDLLVWSGIFFNIHLSQNSEKTEGGTFGENFLTKKVSQCQTKLKDGTFWSRPVLYVTQETFLFQFLGPTGTIWRLLKILLNF